VAADAGVRTRRKGVWQLTLECTVAKMEVWRCGCTLESETTENLCGSKGQNVSPLRRYVAADAGAQAHREGVWQQMPEYVVAETDEWRCRCVPEHKTADNECGSKRRSTTPPRRCMAADTGVRCQDPVSLVRAARQAT